MTVFQRSAPYVVPKPDQAYSAWHHRLFEKRPGALAAERRVVYWLSERLNGALVGSSPVSRPFLAALKGVGIQAIEQIIAERSRGGLFTSLADFEPDDPSLPPALPPQPPSP